MRHAGTVLLVLMTGAACQPSAGPDPCLRRSAGSPSVQFDLGSGEQLWQHVPNFGDAPELTRGDEPVTVVVFEGPHHSIPATGGVQEDRIAMGRSYENVLCVVTARDRTFYADVDFSGLSLDGLDVDRYVP